MKGDKGMLLRHRQHRVCNLTAGSIIEFAGTLLGFDDYVSK